VSTSPPRRAQAAFSERQLRDALGEFATGVTVIATRTPEGGLTGFTANSFNSVSLDPPLVVWSLNRRASQLAAFERTTSYSINVLTHAQRPLAERFAQPRGNRFAGVAFRTGASGAPLIDGCSAWFECRHYSVTPAGDHVLFLGEVTHLERTHAESAMLTFHRGRFGST
jgi:flavin reductase (DIM6/NTAB) family NADH-FMN oxidoreductase RutF